MPTVQWHKDPGHAESFVVNCGCFCTFADCADGSWKDMTTRSADPQAEHYAVHPGTIQSYFYTNTLLH